MLRSGKFAEKLAVGRKIAILLASHDPSRPQYICQGSREEDGIQKIEHAAQTGQPAAAVFRARLAFEQLNGEYRVKNLALKPLWEEVKLLRRQFAFCRFSHISRTQNKVADGLVNQALDEAEGDA